MKHPEVVYTDLEDGAVLLHLQTRFYYSLNDVGQVIWRLLDSTESVDELVQRLMAEYEVEEGQAKERVSAFLQELEREQLAVPHSGEGDQRGGEGIVGAPSPPPEKKPFAEPEVIKHDEPLHEVVMNPFDPQLPLAE
jgi:hypothetical protein